MNRIIVKVFGLFYQRWKYIQNNLHYGKKGKKFKIVKPLRIMGKRFMYFGNGVRILNDARIEVITQWNDQIFHPKLIIGDGTTIEQRCHIIVTNELQIGRNCMFSADVFISDCNHQYGKKQRIAERDLEIKKTTIGDNVFIGIGAKIMPGVTLGNNCVVGANAVVTHDVPAFAIVAGIPATIIKYI